MTARLASQSKSVIIQSLEKKVKSSQQKYAYHKKIAQGYLEMIQKTQQELHSYLGEQCAK